jgi:hypothetical protein
VRLLYSMLDYEACFLDPSISISSTAQESNQALKVTLRCTIDKEKPKVPRSILVASVPVLVLDTADSLQYRKVVLCNRSSTDIVDLFSSLDSYLYTRYVWPLQLSTVQCSKVL